MSPRTCSYADGISIISPFSPLIHLTVLPAVEIPGGSCLDRMEKAGQKAHIENG